MPYDKQSFLAGVSVGSQLRGWAAYPASELAQRISLKTIRLRTCPIFTADMSTVVEYNTRTLNTPGIILVQTFEEAS